FALRYYHLEFPILTNDESFSWRLTQYPPAEVIQRTGADVHPPLYYLLLQGWVTIWGDSPAALRGLSVLFGVLAVFMVYLLSLETARELAKPATIAIAASLFSAFLVAV